MKLLQFLVLLINLIVISNCHIIPGSDLHRIKSYSLKYPSNTKEAFEWRHGIKPPQIKPNLLNYKPKYFLNKEYFTKKTDKPFNFICEFDNKETKDLYAPIIEEAGRQISNAFEIYKTINVVMKIYNFCNDKDYNDVDPCDTVGGMGYVTEFIPLKFSNKENSTIYSFPQALAKQLILDEEIEFSDVDLLILYNSISMKEETSLLSMIHEILHGLGIYNIGMPSQSYYIFGEHVKENFIMPAIYDEISEYNDKYNITDREVSNMGFFPYSVYDKYLVTIPGQSDIEKEEKVIEDLVYFQNIEKRNITKNSIEEVKVIFDEYSKKGAEYEKAKRMAKYYNVENAIGFKTRKNKIIKVQTFNGFYSEGSSIAHIALPFSMERIKEEGFNIENEIDENYLMYYGSTETPDDVLMEKFKNKYGMISQDIVDMMTTLGWTERGHIRNFKRYYVVEE